MRFGILMVSFGPNESSPLYAGPRPISPLVETLSMTFHFITTQLALLIYTFNGLNFASWAVGFENFFVACRLLHHLIKSFPVVIAVKMCRIVVEGTERGRVEIAHRGIILTQAKSLLLHWHMCGLYKKTGGEEKLIGYS